jgi:glycosyltransferase involved in cell wall biosynthesis
MTESSRIAICFPVYCDEATVEGVTRKSLNVPSQIAGDYKVVIVDEGRPDDSGKIADALAEEIEQVSVCHYESNQGYGASRQRAFP